MSFDFQIVNNDLALTADGKLRRVTDSPKLRQDILKIIVTSLGSNRFHPWYGCAISDRVIGVNLPRGMLVEEIQSSITQSLDRLKTLQQAQASSQEVTLGEMIASIEEVRVEENQSDPRQIEVAVVILTRRLTRIEEIFALTR